MVGGWLKKLIRKEEKNINEKERNTNAYYHLVLMVKNYRPTYSIIKKLSNSLYMEKHA